MSRLLIGLLFLFWISGCEVSGGEYCTIDNSYSSSTRSYCDYGCCGTYAGDDRACCDEPVETHASTGVYVGGGVGGFFAAVFWICCFYYCCCRHADNIIHVV